MNNQIDEDHLKVSSLAHVDHENLHTFEIKDLQKLILKVSEDLSAADKARREEFKVSKEDIYCCEPSQHLNLSSNTSSRRSSRNKKSLEAMKTTVVPNTKRNSRSFKKNITNIRKFIIPAISHSWKKYGKSKTI